MRCVKTIKYTDSVLMYDEVTEKVYYSDPCDYLAEKAILEEEEFYSEKDYQREYRQYRKEHPIQYNNIFPLITGNLTIPDFVWLSEAKQNTNVNLNLVKIDQDYDCGVWVNTVCPDDGTHYKTKIYCRKAECTCLECKKMRFKHQIIAANRYDWEEGGNAESCAFFTFTWPNPTLDEFTSGGYLKPYTKFINQLFKKYNLTNLRVVDITTGQIPGRIHPHFHCITRHVEPELALILQKEWVEFIGVDPSLKDVCVNYNLKIEPQAAIHYLFKYVMDITEKYDSEQNSDGGKKRTRYIYVKGLRTFNLQIMESDLDYKINSKEFDTQKEMYILSDLTKGLECADETKPLVKSQEWIQFTDDSNQKNYAHISCCDQKMVLTWDYIARKWYKFCPCCGTRMRTDDMFRNEFRLNSGLKAQYYRTDNNRFYYRYIKIQRAYKTEVINYIKNHPYHRKEIEYYNIIKKYEREIAFLNDSTDSYEYNSSFVTSLKIELIDFSELEHKTDILLKAKNIR